MQHTFFEWLCEENEVSTYILAKEPRFSGAPLPYKILQRRIKKYHKAQRLDNNFFLNSWKYMSSSLLISH